MEHTLKINLNDITYMSELILDIKDVKDLIRRRPSAYDLRHYRSVSRLLIKGGMENG